MNLVVGSLDQIHHINKTILVVEEPTLLSFATLDHSLTSHKILAHRNLSKTIIHSFGRPFERTITMQKDSMGHIGFMFKSGKITTLVKDSSAARNGVLTEHQLIEVNGQNVVGLKDKEIGDIVSEAPTTVTITIMPTVLYEHIVKW